MLVALDFNVLFLALPQLTVDLHASGVQQLWIGDAYGPLVHETDGDRQEQQLEEAS
jgi:DHA2 family multidrug resistance protein-like MFS transporter